MLQYLEWVGSVRSNPGGPFLEIKDGYFNAHPQKHQLIRDFFSKTADLDQDMVDTIMELVESLRLKTQFDDWDDMSSEVDGIWQKITRYNTSTVGYSSTRLLALQSDSCFLIS